MMTREQMLLTLLMEECNEVAQRASKCIRFGLDEVEPTEVPRQDNAERLVYEFNDLLAVISILEAEGHITQSERPDLIRLKKEKVEKWLKYSIERGRLDMDGLAEKINKHLLKIIANAKEVSNG
jgi:hypothetical protein